MTDFQQKRIRYFIKEAETNGWVRLGSGDVDMFEEFFSIGSTEYNKGFKDGIEYVVSGEMAYDEVKEDALKDTY